jgi:hypothetical protein
MVLLVQMTPAWTLQTPRVIDPAVFAASTVAAMAWSGELETLLSLQCQVHNYDFDAVSVGKFASHARLVLRISHSRSEVQRYVRLMRPRVAEHIDSTAFTPQVCRLHWTEREVVAMRLAAMLSMH